MNRKNSKIVKDKKIFIIAKLAMMVKFEEDLETLFTR